MNPFEDLGKTVLCMIENKMIEMLGHSDLDVELLFKVEIDDAATNLILNKLGIEREQEEVELER